MRDFVRARKQAFFFISFALSVVALFPLIVPLSVGMVLAHICETPVEFICRKLRLGRLWQKYIVSALFAILVVALFVVPATFAVASALEDLLKVTRLESGKFSMGLGQAGEVRSHIAQKLAVFAKSYGIPFSIDEILSRINSWLSWLSVQLGSMAGKILSATPGAVFSLGLTFLTWVVFTAEGRRLRALVVPKLIPWEEQRRIVCDTTSDIIKSIVLSNILVSAIQAFLATIIFVTFSIPKALLWGFLSFFATFLPGIGTSIVVLSVAAYCFFVDRYFAGIAIGLSSLLVGVADNILRPFVMKTAINLRFFWILIALIGGVYQFGAMGTLLGPLFLALFVGALRAYPGQKPEEVSIIGEHTTVPPPQFLP